MVCRQYSESSYDRGRTKKGSRLQILHIFRLHEWDKPSTQVAVCSNEPEGPSDIAYMSSLLFLVLATGLLFMKTTLKVIWQKTVSRGGITCGLLKCTLEKSIRRSLGKGCVSHKEWSWLYIKVEYWACMPGNFLGAVDLPLSPADFSQLV